MQKKQEKDVDTLGLVEFDLTEAIKDLIYCVKSLAKDVEKIKKHVKMPIEK